MSQLVCDRPRFVRISGGNARLAEKLFGCPMPFGLDGQINVVTPAPCRVYTAGPFDDFESIAAKTGREGAKLAAFNGGVVYPCRRIFLYDASEAPQ